MRKRSRLSWRRPAAKGRNLARRRFVFEPLEDRRVLATSGIEFTSVLGTFSSGGQAAGFYAASIDWGDATSSLGTVVDQGGGTFGVRGSHTYFGEAQRTAVITVTPQAGASIVLNDPIDVANRWTGNTTAATAVDVGVAPGVHLPALNLDAGTQSWFRFQVLRPDDLTVQLAFAHAAGELTLAVTDSSGTNVLQTASSTADGASATLTGLAAGTYYAHVGGATAATANQFSLAIDPGPASATRVFYVNDGSRSDDYFSTAVGNDLNSGLSPDLPRATIQSILDDYALGSNDLVAIDTGTYVNVGSTITAADQGAAYAGTPGGSTFNSNYSVFFLNNADGNLFHRLRFSGYGSGTAVSDSASGAHSVTRNIFQSNAFSNLLTGIRADNGGGDVVLGNTFTNVTYGVVLNGSGDALRVAGNTFSGVSYGVSAAIVPGAVLTVGGPTAGEGNAFDLVAGGQAIGVAGAITPAVTANISHNTITGGNRGIYLSGVGTIDVGSNTVSSATGTGISATGTGSVHGNQVTQSGTAISSDSDAVSIVGNLLSGNQVGIEGYGQIGGSDWSAGQFNQLSDNFVGIHALAGTTVAFNRIAGGTTGILIDNSAATGASMTVRNNLVTGTTARGVYVHGRTLGAVQIANNTVYVAAGNAVQVDQSSKNVGLKQNILWAQAGYDIAVDTNSQQGFASDWNNLFASASGKIARWQKDFGDLYDWQTEALFDLHSIGYTTPAPTLDDPQFIDVAGGDFRLSPQVSTSIAAGDPLADASQQPAGSGGRIELGAYGNTALAAAARSSQIVLDAPNFYRDWIRSQSQTILWHSLGVSGNVTIELLDAAGNHLSTIASVAAAQGSYSWRPLDSGLVGDVARRYRIRLTSDDNAAVSAQSREPFAVLSGTASSYYVDDPSTGNEQYVTAQGNNRNTGTTAADPKASVLATFASYRLQPGDTLYVDTGTYVNVRNVVISGLLNLGGNQGFTLTGPSDAGKTATLDRGNTNAGTIVLDVYNANFMQVRNLTLTGARTGLWLRNASTHFTGSGLTLTSDVDYGLRQDADSDTAQFTSITASTSGVGAALNGGATSLTGGLFYSNTGGGLAASADGSTGTLTVSGVVAHDNGPYNLVGVGGGVSITASESYRSDVGIGLGRSATASGNTVHDNATGISASNPNDADTTDMVTGNLVYANDTGIALHKSGARGNTVYDSTTAGISAGYFSTIAANVVHDSAIGIAAADSGLLNNRVYANTTGIIAANGAQLTGNVAYSNATGVQLYHMVGAVLNNLIYGNSSMGLLISGAFPGVSVGPDLSNNTIYQLAGDAIRVQSGVRGLRVHNNILWSAAGYDLYVADDSQSGFESDFNDLVVSGTGVVGYWQGHVRNTLSNWRNATTRDLNSLSADPLFVSPVGADGTLGFVDAAHDGRDDDFHERSQYGTYTGGSLAPVLGAGGLPTALAAALATFAEQSPTIDRGDGAASYANEPANNGNYLNLGTYGNTAQASRSPAQYVLVTLPSGGEVWPEGQTFPVSWRSETGTGTVDIDLLRVGNATPVLSIATGANNTGSFSWTIPETLDPAADYQIRITRAGGVVGTSGVFSIVAPVHTYYVNDDAVLDGDLTTATGNDANSGLSADSPKASIAAILQAYNLRSGDTIIVDAGSYVVTANIVLQAAQSGITVRGYHDDAHPTRATLLSRGNTSNGNYTFYVVGATDVAFQWLSFTNSSFAIAGSQADRLSVSHVTVDGTLLVGVSSSGDGITVDHSSFASSYGVDLAGNDATVTNNAMTNAGSYGVRVSGDDATISGNTLQFGNIGIQAAGLRVSVRDNRVGDFYINIFVPGGTATVAHNSVYATIDATGAGIQALGEVQVRDNLVHDAVHGTGIVASLGAVATGNTVYGNSVGLQVGTNSYPYYGSGTATNNRVFGNTTGITAVFGSTISRNAVYGNDTGINGFFFTGVASGNLVYANAVRGMYIGYESGATWSGNTVYQPQGNAVEVESSRANTLRDNILWASSGYDLVVPSYSQAQFASDYNDLVVSGTGKIALWGNMQIASLVDWVLEIGLDQHSLSADPQFIDPDGADNALGYNRTTHEDFGADDNFGVLSTSPTIDAGDPSSLFVGEPFPNGGRVNLGSTGGSSSAASGASGAQSASIQFVSPLPFTKVAVGQTTSIAWRSSGLTLSRLAGEINVGGMATGSWSADALGVPQLNVYTFIGSIDGAINTSGVTRPAPQGVYKTYVQAYARGGATPKLAYSLPVHDGNYTVRLHFAEPSHFAGMRKMDLRINGVTVQTDYDIADAAGGPLRAATLAFSATAAGGQGLTVEVLSSVGSGDGPILSGIELLLDNPSGSATPMADLDLSSDGGATWTSLATGLPMDEAGDGGFDWSVPAGLAPGTYQLRVRSHESPSVLAVSNTFLVVSAGHAYYVNDGSPTGDVFTTAAGDNANSGKDPDHPMASLTALLNAYTPGAGDTIYVDTGTYHLLGNLRLTAANSGLHIVGPSTAVATLDRGNTSFGRYVFELNGATDVEIDRLTLTGAEVAVIGNGAGADRLTLDHVTMSGNAVNLSVHGHGVSVTHATLTSGNYLYGNGDVVADNVVTGGGDYSFYVAGDDAQIHDNDFHDVGGMAYGGQRGSITNNTLRDAGGMSIGGVGSDATIVSGNTVYRTTSDFIDGVSADGNVVLTGNTVYGYRTGIAVYNGARATGNTLHDNGSGIVSGNVGNRAGGVATNNRIYANQVGITDNDPGSDISNNFIYGNVIGLYLWGNSSTVVPIRGNLIYANTSRGVDIEAYVASLVNNTIYQPTGDALVFGRYAGAVTLRNNIVWAMGGYAVHVTDFTPHAIDSDYNDLYVSGTAQTALYNTMAFATLADWQQFGRLIGGTLDTHSLAAAPAFANPAGTDGVLGYDLATTTDHGADDDFRVQAGSPTIDAGDRSSSYANEPGPNGNRINQGHTGNTSQATSSATAFVQVVDPVSIDKLTVGTHKTVTWHAFGLPGGTVDLELSLSGSANWTPIATGQTSDAEGNGSYDWSIPTGQAPGSYQLRVRSHETAGVQGVSAAFLLVNAGHNFYINDASTSGDVFTSAVGDDAASGKDAAHPMATLGALLNTYQPGTGDTIYVDTGTYGLLNDLSLTAANSGLHIVGPSTAVATLARTIIPDTYTFAFRMAGASDVEVDWLAITGNGGAITTQSGYAANGLTLHHDTFFGDDIDVNVAGDDVTVTDSSFSAPNLELGIAGHRARVMDNVATGGFYGIAVSGDDARISGNLVHDARNALLLTGSRGVASGNTLRDNGGVGLRISGPSTASGNLAYLTTPGYGVGIAGYNGATLTANTVHDITYGTGILVSSGSTATGNVSYGNNIGLSDGEWSTGAGTAAGNRLYANQIGAYTVYNSVLSGNRIYSNAVGVRADSVYYGKMLDNLIYANTSAGIVLDHVGYGGPADLTNNTIDQPVGDAIRLQNYSLNVRLRNNIVVVQAGYDVNVAADSQSGFVSDSNLFYKGTDPRGHVGNWNGDRDTLSDWQAATGVDGASVFGNPQFVKPAGADGVLGYSAAGGGYDGGGDDNYQLAASSPAIDRGISSVAPPRDLLGAARFDDQGTTNSGSSDYFPQAGTDSIYTSGTLGTAQGWRTNNYAFAVTLPFAFTFYGTTYHTAYVSTEGFLQFGDGNSSDDGDNSTAKLVGYARIAPLWDNLRTNADGNDIFLDTSVDGRLVVRWQATNEADASQVDFAAVLFADGTIRFDYGPGNTNLTPTVGISAGNGVTYLLGNDDGHATLGNAASLQFSVGAGIVDIGAFEFQGSSLDTTAPTISGTTPGIVALAGTTKTSFHSISLLASEFLNTIDASAPAAYALRGHTGSGPFGGASDTVYAVVPHYAPGSLDIVLDVVVPGGGDLPLGNYQFTAFGDRLHDLAGLALAGGGTAGTDYVRTFTIAANQPPALDLNGAAAGSDYATTFVLGQSGVAAVDAAHLTVADADDTTLVAASITLTNPLDGTAESLSADVTSTGIAAHYDSGTGVLNLSGTASLAQYQQVLRSVQYHNAQGAPNVTDRVLRFVVNDGTADSTPATSTIAISAHVNVAPVNSVPTGTLYTPKNVALVFAGGSGVSIADADAGGADVQVTLAATHGTLALGSTANLTSLSGNTSDTIVVVGTIANVNAALDGLAFTPAAGYTGAASVQITTYDQGNTGSGGAQTDTDTINVSVVSPPTVESVVVNGSAAALAGNQRSMVADVTVTFSGLVTIDAGAFNLVKNATGGAYLTTINVNSTVSAVNGKTVVVLTFSGAGVESNVVHSLMDGNYVLTVFGSAVHDGVSGINLDGDGDGSAGGNKVFGSVAADKFFRLFGDSDGDRDADTLDYARFRNAFSRLAGQGGFAAAFDFDGDSDVDTLDYARFRGRFGTRAAF